MHIILHYDQAVESDGIYETAPMGLFEVSEANRKAKCLEIKAYERMPGKLLMSHKWKNVI